ncbi:hypothetical protein GmHk_08G023215 [Glycine max]|uniref:oleosin-like n=1 Tax=Glycine max TaxID=3847 RepID=UPI0007193B45|nr:oleosin-like [Glycine max]XP_028246708.1 uncharacterized protein LOC114424038 [Glycine soja]KAH1238574.1 hypothetical protein GmHk_08G023215 [Glycine max]|eukprot:XP_014633940.1 uncharacterized protein LOC106799559 [Glycine max]
MNNPTKLVKTALENALNATLLLSLLDYVLSLATSFLGKLRESPTPTQLLGLLITPLWNLLRGFVTLGLVMLLLLAGIVIALFILLMPLLLIVTSPIWIPTAMVLLLVTTLLLFVCGFIVVVVAMVLRAFRSFGSHNPLS